MARGAHSHAGRMRAHTGWNAQRAARRRLTQTGPPLLIEDLHPQTGAGRGSPLRAPSWLEPRGAGREPGRVPAVRRRASRRQGFSNTFVAATCPCHIWPRFFHIVPRLRPCSGCHRCQHGHPRCEHHMRDGDMAATLRSRRGSKHFSCFDVTSNLRVGRLGDGCCGREHWNVPNRQTCGPLGNRRDGSNISFREEFLRLARDVGKRSTNGAGISFIIPEFSRTWPNTPKASFTALFWSAGQFGLDHFGGPPFLDLSTLRGVSRRPSRRRVCLDTFLISAHAPACFHQFCRVSGRADLGLRVGRLQCEGARQVGGADR